MNAFDELMLTFNLERPKVTNILIDDFQLVDGKIVINSAKVLDNDLKFIRFADLTKLLPHLSNCNVIFNVGKQNSK
jgi:hypothetical protein